MDKLVSAVITTHNRIDLLLKAIESVKTQTYRNIECIVVDDVSTDETKRIMEEYQEKGDIKYIRIDVSRGGNFARNEGIRNAEGEYIAFLDDDDEWYPTKIEKQLHKLDEHPDAKLCYCSLRRVYNGGEKIEDLDVNTMKEGDLSKEILKGVICTTSAMMVEKNLLYEIGLFDESLKFWQEYDLCIRICQKTKVVAVRENLVLYRINIVDTARLTNKLQGWEEAVRQVEDKYKDLFATLSPEETMERQKAIVIDGLWRCFFSGNKKAQKTYLKKRFYLEKTIRNLLRYVLNRGMHL